MDQSLQLSRRSVYAEMASRHDPARLPRLVRKRIETVETDGRYVIQRPLAAGGMGAVLAVEDHDFGRDTAMKVIHARSADDPVALERFLDEAHITAQLEHPNIVPIHDLGVMPDGTLYYTMKLIHGQSLAGVLKAIRADDPEEIARWDEEQILLTFLKVLDGVGYAHSRGVVHRDIKPDNIMVDRHGEVLVVDWGIAVVARGQQDPSTVRKLRDDMAHSATMTGALMGTPLYMAPEQAAGEAKRVDQRADIFSLGATLYELLSHERAYPNCSMRELLQRAQEGRWIPLQERLPDGHPDLIAIVHKAMAVEPGHRYRDCAAFAADLRAYLAGQAVQARRRNLIERLGQWLQRHRRQALAAAAMLLVAVAAAGTVRMLDQQQRQRQAGELLQTAEALLSDAEHQPANRHLQQTRQARERVTEARALAPDLDGLLGLSTRIERRIGEAEAELARQRQAAMQAQQAASYAEQAEAALAGGDLDEAAGLLDAGLRLEQLDPEQRQQLQALRDRLGLELADRQRSARHAAAAEAVATARSHLQVAATHLQQLPSVDARAILARNGAIDDIRAGIARIRELLQQAAAQLEQASPPPPGYEAAVTTLARLRQQSDARLISAEALAADYRSSRELGGQTRTALAEGDLETAAASVAKALERLPVDPDLQALQQRISSARAERARERELAAQQAERQRQLQEAMTRADQGLADWREQGAALASSEQRIDSLRRQLAGAEVADRDPLYTAMDERRRIDDARQDAWQRTEQAAIEALGLAEADADQTTTMHRLLADLYGESLRLAEAAGDAARARDLRMRLRRHDLEGRWLPRGDSRAQLRLGGDGQLQLAPMELRGGRLQAGSGEQRSLPLHAPLAPGRWLLQRQDQQLAVQLAPGEQRQLEWPEPLRLAVPGAPVLRLDWVAEADGGFWLGRDEVTQEHYLAFCNAPEQLQAIRAAVARLYAGDQQVQVPFVPAADGATVFVRSREESDGLWPAVLVDDDRMRAEQVIVSSQAAQLPVAGLSRADAEAFCAWLAASSGQRIQ
ncbi:MAG: protein kinase domain-containing protein, partial [Planctomycetota bacterium]